MGTDTQDLVRTFEQLPEAKKVEVADFAKFLLAQGQDSPRPAPVHDMREVERWLATARGAAKAGVTTDEVMQMTRGET